MPGSATALRQERLKKTHARTIPLVLFTINEEDELQKNGNSRRPKGMLMPYWSPVQHCPSLAYRTGSKLRWHCLLLEYSGPDPARSLVRLTHPQGMEYDGVSGSNFCRFVLFQISCFLRPEQFS